MVKRIATLAVATVLLLAWIVAPAFSKGMYEHHERAAARLTDNVTNYSFPKVRFKPVAKGDIVSPADDNAANNPYPRASLGTSLSPSGVASPGFAVIESYNDDQMFPGGNRQVDFRGATPSIHFAYGSAKSTTQPGKFGYNVYDPVGGVWPRGAGVGCEIQAADAEGWWNNMDVGPQ
ncbi:MAG: hypothetical protein JSU65_00395, partial [Candidatus Zixiibacteriota bacterium]